MRANLRPSITKVTSSPHGMVSQLQVEAVGTVETPPFMESETRIIDAVV